MTNRPLVYLAVPYTHEDPAIVLNRFHKVNLAAGKLMGMGHSVFSPISHTHPIAICCDLPKDWEFWKKFDTAYLSVCRELFVLQLQGWDSSKGVQAEIEIAKEQGIPITYLPPDFVS